MPWFSLYRHVLDQSLAHGMKSKEATKGKRSATVLVEAEYTCLLEAMERLHQWMAKLMYGSGLSLMECIRLRVKDVDFWQGPFAVSPGGKYPIAGKAFEWQYLFLLASVPLIQYRGKSAGIMS
ncbi:MAG: hypothetical protein HOK45_05285 [Verrucomicrobia bacterium]|jgi:integrase|nr:hypothetical protein [Verrucomicrobiota bacterium]